MYNFYLGIGD